MKWRLREGQGEAIYEIGVGDDGFLHGLTAQEMEASLSTLRTMADRLGASITILRTRWLFLFILIIHRIRMIRDRLPFSANTSKGRVFSIIANQISGWES